MNSDELTSRRDFIKRTAYVAPVVLTLSAKPAFASSGSGRCDTSSDGCNDTHELPEWLIELIKKTKALLG